MDNYDIELYKEHLFCVQNALNRLREVSEEYPFISYNEQGYVWLTKVREAIDKLKTAQDILQDWIDSPKNAQRKETLFRNMF